MYIYVYIYMYIYIFIFISIYVYVYVYIYIYNLYILELSGLFGALAALKIQGLANSGEPWDQGFRLWVRGFGVLEFGFCGLGLRVR